MITVTKTNLQDVLLIKPEIFTDHRGQYVELYNEDDHNHFAGAPRFVQDDVSVSHRDVLRGIHGDSETWKLISCLHGRIYLVVVCCDKESPQWGQWQDFTLSGVNRHQVLVPPKFGVGHLVLSKKAIFHYKQNRYYRPEEQFTYRYDDPLFNIWWPCANPILSQRDSQ